MINVLDEATSACNEFHMNELKHEAKLMEVMEHLWDAIHRERDDDKRIQLAGRFKVTFACLAKLRIPYYTENYLRFVTEEWTEDTIANFLPKIGLPENTFAIDVEKLYDH